MSPEGAKPPGGESDLKVRGRRELLFLTATRADFGKLKSLMTHVLDQRTSPTGSL